MALTITKADVIAVAGELAGNGTGTPPVGLTDDQWTLVLLLTAEQVAVSAFHSVVKANLAARYLAAHIALGIQGGVTAGYGSNAATGELQSVTVGAISKTFATGSDGSGGGGTEFAAELQRTAYGAEYYRLLKMWVFRMRLTDP